MDIRDRTYGSWFTGKLLKIKKSNSPIEDNSDAATTSMKDDGLVYTVELTGYKCLNVQFYII